MRKQIHFNTFLIVVLSLIIFGMSLCIFFLHKKIVQLEEQNYAQREMLTTVLTEIKTLNITVKTGKTNLTSADIMLISERLTSAEKEVDKLVRKYGK